MLILFVWTGSQAALMAACALASVAIILALGVLLTRWRTEVRISVPVSTVVGGSGSIVITLQRGLPLSLALLKMDIVCESATFQSREVRTALTALNSKGRSEVRIPLEADRYGRMQVRIQNCCAEDPLGLFRSHFDWSESKSCIVYPTPLSLTTSVRHVPLARTFGSTYDETRGGSDVDEVFNIREFQAGDHLSSVHWKLTSKFDVMMSRQFSLPVDFELIVVCLGTLEGAYGEPLTRKVLNGTASVSEAVSADLLQQGLYHNFATPVRNDLVSVVVDGREAIGAVSELMLGAPLNQSYNDAVACLMSSQIAERFTKCVLITPVFDESLWSTMALEMDLSVVLVGQGADASEVSGNFNLVIVNAEDGASHERSIAL